MTPADIDNEIAEQVAALVRAGQVPTHVELGQDEVAALAAVGRGTHSFTTSYMVGEGPSFHAIGATYPQNEVKPLILSVLIVDERMHIRVMSATT